MIFKEKLPKRFTNYILVSNLKASFKKRVCNTLIITLKSMYYFCTANFMTSRFNIFTTFMLLKTPEEELKIK